MTLFSAYRPCITICLLFFLTVGSAQKVLSVDLGKIRDLTDDITSSSYYPSLLIRFQNFDSTLTKKELHFLYYGKYFQPFYHPMTVNQEEERMYDLLSMNSFDAALVHGLRSFDKDPINLKTIFGIYICYDQMGNDIMAEKFQLIYFEIIAAILESGTGNHPDQAFVIMDPRDQYEIINSLEKKIKSESSVSENTVLFRLKRKDKQSMKRPKKIYFNLAIPQMKGN